MSIIDDIKSLAEKGITIQPFVDEPAGMVGFTFRSPIRDESGRNKFIAAVHVDSLPRHPANIAAAVAGLFNEAAEAFSSHPATRHEGAEPPLGVFITSTMEHPE